MSRALFLSLFLLSGGMVLAGDFQEALSSLPQVRSVRPLGSSTFSEKYELLFVQPIDHRNPSTGTFTQRVVVGHIHPDSASVVVCQGYGAEFAYRDSYRDEISDLFNTNDIVVEHRYFNESTPYPGADYSEVNWDYMTGEQEAEDLHVIVSALKTLYNGKWISSGISKGGQNTMIYRVFFPEDVDFSIPYVGPVCRGVEDGRHEPFIRGYCGSKEDRKAVLNFQKDLLRNREALQPLLDSLVKAEGLEFNLPADEIFDYCVLEFSFAFWQWGTSVPAIPSRQAPLQEKFDFMVGAAGPDYFVRQSETTPFFVQAAKELGYYGYDVRPFRKWLHIASAEGYLEKIFLPRGCSFKFDRTLYEKVTEFIRTTDARMLFIYGQYDPWSSVMPDNPEHDNIRFFIQPGGSHRARINTFDDATREQIIDILSEWLYER